MKYGTLREDGFKWDGRAWRSPAAWKRHEAGKREYAKNIVRPCLNATDSDAGQAAEHFVVADLLARGLRVTKPMNINGAHDLHVKCGRRWATIQVKSAEFNKRTGYLRVPSIHTLTSDVVAAVYMPALLIKYLPKATSVPKELKPRLTILYGGDVSVQSSSSKNANAATTTKNAYSRRMQSKPARSAGSRSKSSGAHPRNVAQASPAKETEA